MSVFIFQSVAEQFDLREVLRPGRHDTWYATRYRGDMKPRDIVFFWMGGSEQIRGLYGWGRIVSPPYIKPEWDSHGVDVTYEVRFGRPVLASRIRRDSILGGMLIFRAPQATNFLLAPTEAQRLADVVRECAERAPDVGGEPWPT